jgi:hypothetical protein
MKGTAVTVPASTFKLCLLTTQCVCVFRVILALNSGYTGIQKLTAGICIPDCDAGMNF